MHKILYKVAKWDLRAREYENILNIQSLVSQSHNGKNYAETKIYCLKNSNEKDLVKDLNNSRNSHTSFMGLRFLFLRRDINLLDEIMQI